jgi:protein HIRA/HIR1
MIRALCRNTDVADLAWNMDDSMIASVGLDSTVFIWDGYTFGEDSPMALASAQGLNSCFHCNIVRSHSSDRSAPGFRQGSMLGSRRTVSRNSGKLRLAQVSEIHTHLKHLCGPLQSDDKSVKIWSTEDWSLVAAVEKPFQSSPANTFFRRLR